MALVRIETFYESPIVDRIRQVLTAPVKNPIWWTIRGETPKTLDYTTACRTCEFVRTPKGRKICQNQFLQAVAQAHQTKASWAFLCPIEKHAVCIPVKNRESQVEGYLAVCHSEKPVSTEGVTLAEMAAETGLREMNQAKELKMLSETVQPRCVALSTVHTIHRLISSSLDLKELLPRMARLCCQVLRSEFCAIWLLDRERKMLVPRAVVNIHQGRNGAVHASRLGSGVIGSVASKCQVRLLDRTLIVPLIEEDCIGVIMVRRSREGTPFGNLDQEILTTLAEQAVVAIRNAHMYETQERVTWGTIRSLSAILDGMDVRSPRRKGTQRQFLADLCLAIAEKMGIRSSQLRPLQYAALLHDAGRIGIPDEIVRKPSKLNPSEFKAVKEHTVKGARLLEPLEILEPAVPIILHHHERYDGTGYPKGLKGEAIPLGARILSVANAFEAMISERPYRRSLSVGEAAHEIASHTGTQFDPKVVKVFLVLLREGKLEELVSRYFKEESRSRTVVRRDR